jgi:hypothetical protein
VLSLVNTKLIALCIKRYMVAYHRKILLYNYTVYGLLATSQIEYTRKQ